MVKKAKFKACGVDKNNKRFSIKSDDAHYIDCINMYKGNAYALQKNGKYKIVKSV